MGTWPRVCRWWCSHPHVLLHASMGPSAVVMVMGKRQDSTCNCHHSCERFKIGAVAIRQFRDKNAGIRRA